MRPGTDPAVARRLGVRQSWVYLKADAGHRRLGGNDGLIRFLPAEIDDWLEAQRRALRAADVIESFVSRTGTSAGLRRRG